MPRIRLGFFRFWAKLRLTCSSPTIWVVAAWSGTGATGSAIRRVVGSFIAIGLLRDATAIAPRESFPPSQIPPVVQAVCR